MIEGIILRLIAPSINFFTNLVNLVIKRDKTIVLFGAWMGEKFADNSRYLFQYLHEHGSDYGIKKVVWVTRNSSVYNMLKDMGYDCYQMHDLKSFYYHFRAGYHIDCNMNFATKQYKGDIMGQFSSGAVKYNLWHGIPLKSGGFTNKNHCNDDLLKKVLYKLRMNKKFMSIFSPGKWNLAKYASVGKFCTERCKLFHGLSEENFIMCGYPRNEFPIKLLKQEKAVLDTFKLYNKVLIYLPTFRENGIYSHPLESEKIRNLILDNNILWLEKAHVAEKNRIKSFKGSNFYYLHNDFDINVLLPNIDLLITDYSSVCYDAFFLNKPVIFYSPDYQNYIEKERGFICDYKNVVGDFCAYNHNELNEYMTNFIENKNIELFKNNSKKQKATVYDQEYSYELICNKLFIENNS